MKTSSPTDLFNPLYVLLAGSFGVFIAWALFMWNYPAPDDPQGQAFVATHAFAIWLFLFVVLCCFLAVVILPVWGMAIGMFRQRIYAEAADIRRRAIVLIVAEGVFLTLAVVVIFQLVDSFRGNLHMENYVPRGHSARMAFIYVYAYLTALPALLGMVLIHTAIRRLSHQIDTVEQTDKLLFAFIPDVLSYRSQLQNYLMIVGIILSLVPINTAGLRAILIALDPQNEQAFPITNAILFGLVFTLFLLLIYAPTHIALTETSRKLRDRLRPLDSLATLKADLEQRKSLDDLLQTNIGLSQNLRTGLITLSPLLASLIASLLGVNVNLP